MVASNLKKLFSDISLFFGSLALTVAYNPHNNITYIVHIDFLTNRARLNGPENGYVRCKSTSIYSRLLYSLYT